MCPEIARLLASYIVLVVTVPDWGNVPEWLTMIVTLGALGAAIYAGRAAWRSTESQRHTLELQRGQLDSAFRANEAQQRTLELQREQLDDAREQAEQAQASKVAFYVPGRDLAERYTSDEGKQKTRFTRANLLRVFNASDVPVFGLVLWDNAPEPRLLFESLYLIPNGGDPVDALMLREKRHPDTDCRLYFRDAAGVGWVRDHGGALAKASDDDAATAERVIREHAEALGDQGTASDPDPTT